MSAPVLDYQSSEKKPPTDPVGTMLYVAFFCMVLMFVLCAML